MLAAKANEFKHTTAKSYPDKIGGYVLLDEEPGFTGIYVIDAATGLLWPARTVNRAAEAHYKLVCGAWLAREGAEDRRTIKEPTFLDLLRSRLTTGGVMVVIESDTKLVSDPDGLYELYGSDESPHISFEATEYGNGHIAVIVKCPLDYGGKTEEYGLQDIETAIARIISIFGDIDAKIAQQDDDGDEIPEE